MPRNNRFTLLLGLALSLILLPGSLSAQEAVEQAYGDEYASADFGRIRYQDDGVTIYRAVVSPDAGPADKSNVNAPIFPGDTVLTASDQRAEIELAGGSLVWLDRDSEVTFLALPSSAAEYSDNTVIQISEGTLRVQSLVDANAEFRIDTPAGSVFLIDNGDFRIEVDGDETLVISRRGVAEIVGDAGSVLVRSGMRTEVEAGERPDDPSPFNTFAADRFDDWVQDREDGYRAHDQYSDDPDAYESLPDEVRPYYRELSRYGDWSYDSEYGYVWFPADTPSSWRPYHDGYWHYGASGYFWVSHEPWGWAPYHYGRWNWVAGRGWCWTPGRRFGGAWVAWSLGSSHLGWSPLSYWNRPCYVGSPYYGYYDYYSWTFLNYSHVGYRHYPRYAVDVRKVGSNLAAGAVVTRSPRFSPRQLSEGNAAREKAHQWAKQQTVARVRPPKDGSSRKIGLHDLERRLDKRDANKSTRQTRPTRADGRSKALPTGQTRPTRADGRSKALPTRRPTTRPERTRTPVREKSARPQVRPRSSQQNDANSRRRSLYEEMDKPQRTRERKPSAADTRRKPSSTPRSRPQSPTRQKATPRPAPTRSKAKPKPAPTRPKATRPQSRPSRPKSSGSRSGGSKARPSRSSGNKSSGKKR